MIHDASPDDTSRAGTSRDAATPDDASLDDALLETSILAAREAAALQSRLAGTLDPTAWSEKGTSDFVTDVDRESERMILARTMGRFPSHGVLAEEGTLDKRSVEEGGSIEEGRPGEQGGSAPPRPEAPILWIIDPLDGTTNWLHGYPAYAVSIATLDERGLRTGVVLNSATGEEFAAIRGRGATLNGEPIRVSELSESRLALVGTGFPFKKTELLPGYLRALGAVLEASSGVRRTGAAAVDLCDVARGRLDAFWEHWLLEWDVAAGALIVREAGGVFGPLPAVEDPVLAEAVSGGQRVCSAFDGTGELAPVGGGGFMAGNGLVDGQIARLWLATMQRGPAAPPSDSARSHESLEQREH